MQKKLSFNFFSGQALLTLILIMAVGLTIGLSLAARSIIDVKLSTQIEESSRAFSAAEAGIEQSLQSGIAVPKTELEEIRAEYEVSVANIGGDTSLYQFPGEITSNDTQSVWLVDHQEGDDYSLNEASYYQSENISLCWSKVSDTDPVPAMEVSIIYNEGGDYKVVRGAYDPDPASRSSPNNFDSIDPPAGGICENYQYRKDLNFYTDFGIASPPGSNLVALRVRPIYAAAKIAVDPPEGGDILPLQGKERVALGRTESGVSVKIIVYESYPSLPEIFDYALFSGSDLTK